MTVLGKPSLGAGGPEPRAREPFKSPAAARLVRLILVESGNAGFDPHAAGYGGNQMLGLGQWEGEGAAAFAVRVVRRIGALERGRLTVERTFLVLGPRFDAEATVARLLVARALITHSAIAPGRASELVLSASQGTRGETQRWLPRLVDALIGEARSGALTIAVEWR